MSATRSLDATVEALCGDLSAIRAPRGTELNARSWATEAPLQPGAGVRAAREFVRSLSPRLRDDRPLSSDIELMAAAIGDGSLVEAVESEAGELR